MSALLLVLLAFYWITSLAAVCQSPSVLQYCTVLTPRISHVEHLASWHYPAAAENLRREGDVFVLLHVMPRRQWRSHAYNYAHGVAHPEVSERQAHELLKRRFTFEAVTG